MFLSTLPELPNGYHVQGAVFAAQSLHGVREGNVPQQFAELMNQIIAQANQLRADGIIDITVTRIAESAYAIIGTAVAAAITR